MSLWLLELYPAPKASQLAVGDFIGRAPLVRLRLPATGTANKHCSLLVHYLTLIISQYVFSFANIGYFDSSSSCGHFEAGVFSFLTWSYRNLYFINLSITCKEILPNNCEVRLPIRTLTFTNALLTGLWKCLSLITHLNELKSSVISCSYSPSPSKFF